MMQLNFSPFPFITTLRLTLRQLRSEDAAAIFDLRSDPVVLRYLDRPAAKSLSDATLYIADMNRLVSNNEIIIWGITLQPSDIVIGTVCFWQIEKNHYRAEVGCVLKADQHRRGIMKEALSAVIDYGFNEMNLHSIAANVNPKNEASIALLKSMSFVQEAYFRENYYFNGNFLDSMIFCLVNKSPR